MEDKIKEYVGVMLTWCQDIWSNEERPNKDDGIPDYIVTDFKHESGAKFYGIVNFQWDADENAYLVQPLCLFFTADGDWTADAFEKLLMDSKRQDGYMTRDEIYLHIESARDRGNYLTDN